MISAQDFQFIVWPVWNSWQTTTICKLTVPAIRDPILIIIAREMIIPVAMQTIIINFCEQFSRLQLQRMLTKPQLENIVTSLKMLTITSASNHRQTTGIFLLFFPFTILRNPFSRSKWIAFFVYIIFKTPSSPTFCSCIAWFYIFHNSCEVVVTQLGWASQQDLFHYYCAGLHIVVCNCDNL